MIRAVVFDLDGVLLDSEHLWDVARRAVVARTGGTWADGASAAMQGMSSPEWSAYLRDELGVERSQAQVVDLVVGELMDGYRRQLPLVAGAVETVRRIGARWPLALASSSNRVVIEEVLALAGLGDAFAVTVSSEEVAHGKPAPDVYAEAVRQLGAPPAQCAAVEDSANGIRSAAAAGLRVVAVPDRRSPPGADVLAVADAVLSGIDELTVELVERLGGPSLPTRTGSGPASPGDEKLDEEEVESFPASDPHSDWAGPPG